MSKNQVLQRQKMTIIPSTEPAQVDLVYANEDGTPRTEKKVKKGHDDQKDKVVKVVRKHKAIYRIEGDRMTLSMSWVHKQRPSDFKPGAGLYVLSLVKVKDDTKQEKASEKKVVKARSGE